MRAPFILLLTSLASAQSTWIVDDTPGPGVNFTSLPAAVAAAASGDTLLVGPGTYEGFQVANKALTILGAGSTTMIGSPAPSTPVGAPIVEVTTPPPGTTFRMSGLRISTSTGTPSAHLQLTGNTTSGNVVLSDVTTGLPAASSGVGLSAFGIDLHLSRCAFHGSGSSSAPFAFGTDGAHVFGGSRLVADECVFDGGSAQGSTSTIAVAGGHGMWVTGSKVWIWRSSVTGGDVSSVLGIGTMGGNALQVSGTSTVRVNGSAADALSGGDAIASSGTGGTGIVGSAGSAVAVCGPVTVSGGAQPSGSAPVISGPGISMGLPARPVTSVTGTPAVAFGGDLAGSSPVTLRFQGAPLQYGGFFVNVYATVLEFPGLTDEPLLVDSTALVLFAGLLDASGEFVFTFVPATQAPLVQNLPLHFQGFVYDPVSGTWLGSNATLRRIR